MEIIADRSRFWVDESASQLLMSRTLATAIESTSSYIAFFIIAILILVAPWAYGGVEQWFRSNQAVLLALAVIVTLGSLFFCHSIQSPKSLFLAISPLSILFGIASVQSLGSGSLIGAHELVGSIYPAATRVAIASILAAIAALWLGGVLLSRERYFSGFLLTCLVGASVVAFVGIAMRLSGDDRVIRGLPVFGDPFARFVNRNNAAGFMLLGLSSGLALLSRKNSRSPVDEESADPDRAYDHLTFLLITATLTTLSFGGILASRSRGGIVAAAVVVFASLFFLKPRNKRASLALIASVAIGGVSLVAWLGLAYGTMERFASLRSHEVLSTGRIPHWSDAVNAFKARPVLGFGLGTYGYSYSKYSENVSELWYEHADNQFVEVAVETGAAGLSCLILFYAITVFALIRNTGSSREKILVSLLVLGLTVHSVFDYAVIIPAVLVPASILWSSGIVRLLSDTPHGPSGTTGFTPRVITSTFCVALTAGLAWASVEHRKAWAVDRESVEASRLLRPDTFSHDALDSRIRKLERSLVHRPDDAEGQRSLAQLLVYRYRSTTFEALNAANPVLERKAAWNATNLTVLHKAATALARAGAVRGVESLQRDPRIQRDLLPARQHYKASLEACHVMPGTHLPLNALRVAEPGSDVLATTELEEARELFPTDVGLLRAAGKMAWHAGNTRVAKDCWQRAFSLSNEGFESTIQSVFEEEGAETAVDLVFPETAEAAISVISTPEAVKNPLLRLEIADRLVVLAQSLPDEVLSHRLKAFAAWYRGDDAEASTLFRETVELAPLDASIRHDSANFEWASGRMNTALQQLETAITLAPERDELRRLYATWEALRQRALAQDRNESL